MSNFKTLKTHSDTFKCMLGYFGVSIFHRTLIRRTAGSQACTIRPRVDDDDDDVELYVLEGRVDILGTNCDQCVSTAHCCFTSTETVKLIMTKTEPRTAT